MSDKPDIQRRTKRRYAHKLYPHADEWEVRPLSVEVPYLLAQTVGLSVFGTGWREDLRAGTDRIVESVAATHFALLADAIHQGMTGDEAWQWAASGGDGQAQSEQAHERAVQYGVPVHLIKPYPCGPEPGSHDHMASTGDSTGEGLVTRIEGAEEECETCTEAAT